MNWNRPTLLSALSWVPLILFVLSGCGKESQAPPPAPGGGPRPVVLIATSLGDISVELDPARAPATVENFLRYADEGYYDGTIFHRVIPGFMIQGGGLLPDMAEKPGGHPPIKNEAGNGLQNRTGAVAMARTREVDSAASQFFINTVDNPPLDHRDDSPQGFGYAVFGRVLAGMEVVKKIEQVKTTRRGMHENVPVEPVVIKSVRRAKTSEAK